MDHQTLFNILFGIIAAGGGFFAREIWVAVKELREDLHRLEVNLPQKYVAKDDFAEAMKDLKTQITHGFNRINDKLDGKQDK